MCYLLFISNQPLSLCMSLLTYFASICIIHLKAIDPTSLQHYYKNTKVKFNTLALPSLLEDSIKSSLLPCSRKIDKRNSNLDIYADCITYKL